MPARIDRYDWAAVDALSRRLAATIDRRFDVIVAVLRGGAVPATIVANEWGIDRMVGLKIVQDGQTATAGTGPGGYRGAPGRILVPLNPLSLAGQRVLVVDDVLDSGESVRLALKTVHDQGAAEVRLATLQVKSYAPFRPDYWVEETTNWIFYPWMAEWEYAAMAAKLQASPTVGDPLAVPAR